MRNRLGILALVLLVGLGTPGSAQLVPDTTYRFGIEDPAYAKSTGPRVCIDAAHRNQHTLHGRYRPFATMLEQDGYRVRSNDAAFAANALRECDVVVIISPLPSNLSASGTNPHESAFDESELSALASWIWSGGSLLLISDHRPAPGNQSALATVLGFTLFNGSVHSSDSGWPDVFGEPHESVYRFFAQGQSVDATELRQLAGEPGKLGAHPILRGRNPREGVSTVVTFTGTAFHGARDVEPLLIWGRDAAGAVNIGGYVPGAQDGKHWPVSSFRGWLHAGVRRFGAGRVAVLGESGMCNAQLGGAERLPVGMNAPYKAQNAQFCLNVIRWLSGVLE